MERFKDRYWRFTEELAMTLKLSNRPLQTSMLGSVVRGLLNGGTLGRCQVKNFQNSTLSMGDPEFDS